MSEGEIGATGASASAPSPTLHLEVHASAAKDAPSVPLRFGDRRPGPGAVGRVRRWRRLAARRPSFFVSCMFLFVESQSPSLQCLGVTRQANCSVRASTPADAVFVVSQQKSTRAANLSQQRARALAVRGPLRSAQPHERTSQAQTDVFGRLHAAASSTAEAKKRRNSSAPRRPQRTPQPWPRTRPAKT